MSHRRLLGGLALRFVGAWLLWIAIGAAVAAGCLPLLGIPLGPGLAGLGIALAAAALGTLAVVGWACAAAWRVLRSLDEGDRLDSRSLLLVLNAPPVLAFANGLAIAGALFVMGAVGRLAIDPRSGAIFGLAAFGVLQAAGLRAGTSWRSMLGVVTDRISPARMRVPTGHFLAPAFGARLASVSFAVVAVVGAVLSAWVPAVPPFAAFAAATLAAVAMFRVGVGFGRRIVADLEDLRTYAAFAAAGSAWAEQSVVPEPPTRARASVSMPVVKAVSQLTQRYAEMARAEERARQSVSQTRELKTRFMAMMSHDLRSPLNSITGFAEVLSEELDGPLEEGQRESVTAIREAGEDLSRLVTDILDSARLETGRLPLEREWVPLVTLLGRAIGDTRARLRSNRVALEPRLEAGLPPLWVDPDRVVQALVGMLIHVCRMVGEGTIVFDARRAEGGVQVAIHAAELPADDSRRIFDALRVVRDASGQRAGLGLGLSLARGLVEANGGSLTYDSMRAGGRFTLILPTEPPSR